MINPVCLLVKYFPFFCIFECLFYCKIWSNLKIFSIDKKTIEICKTFYAKFFSKTFSKIYSPTNPPSLFISLAQIPILSSLLSCRDIAVNGGGGQSLTSISGWKLEEFHGTGVIGDWPRPFVIIEFVGHGWWDSSWILRYQPCGYLAFSQVDLTVVVIFGIFRSTLEIFQISFGCDFQIRFRCVILFWSWVLFWFFPEHF